MLRLALAVLFGMTAAACASPADVAFQNFRNIMQLDIGRSVDDPYNYRNQYANRRIQTRELANGNIEEEFQRGRGGRCPVFFEIDNTAQKIVAWRYEGAKEDCGITP